MHAGPQPVEHRDRRAAGVGWRLEHQRRHGRDQHGLGHPLGAVVADVAGDFAAAGGMADVDGGPQVQAGDKLVQVGGVGVHVLAVEGLARPAVAAAVMTDAAKAVGGQEEHLVFPGIHGQRPAVAEEHRRPAAPVVVVNHRAVFGRDRAVPFFDRPSRGRNARLPGRCGHRHCWHACGGGNASAGDQELAPRCRHFQASLCCGFTFVGITGPDADTDSLAATLGRHDCRHTGRTGVMPGDRRIHDAQRPGAPYLALTWLSATA